MLPPKKDLPDYYELIKVSSYLWNLPTGINRYRYMSKTNAEDDTLNWNYSETRWYSKDSKSHPERELQKSWRLRKWCYAHVRKYTAIQYWRILGKSQNEVLKHFFKKYFFRFSKIVLFFNLFSHQQNKCYKKVASFQMLQQ